MAVTPEELQKAFEIAKTMPLEELEAIIRDVLACGRCGECKAGYGNNILGLNCNGSHHVALSEKMRRKEEETPKPEPETVAHQSADMLSFGRTIQFMRDRGYKRCYMCGSSLTGGGDNGS